MESLLQDLRFALRMLAAKPLHTTVAVLTLALGIGATSAIFSVVDTVLLRPLPYAQPDRIASLWETDLNHGVAQNQVSRANYWDWVRQNQVFSELGAVKTAAVTLSGEGDFPERLLGGEATPSFFHILGVEPLAGHVFRAEDGRPGGDKVVLLGSRLWSRRFGSSPAVVGKRITLDGDRYTVVGVLSAEPLLLNQPDFFVPLVIDPADPGSRSSHPLQVVGRLKPGTSIGQAQANLEAIAARLAVQYPDADAGWGAKVETLRDHLVGGVRTLLLVLQGAVLFVLLVACANVANLQLVRATARRREIAMRLALGAPQRRLVRQMLVESTVLGLLGGALGLVVAWGGIHAITRFGTARIPRLDEIAIDPQVLLFTLAISLVTGLIFGMAPISQSWRPDLSRTLRGARSSPGAAKGLRAALVVAEIALSLMLLVGAGLFVRSFWRLLHVQSGFDADNVLTLRVSLPYSRYERPQQAQFFEQLVEKAAAIPGIQAAGLVSDLPVSENPGLWENEFHVDGHPPRNASEASNAYMRWVGGDYFSAMRIPLIRGRSLAAHDVTGQPRAVVIDQTMANKFFPGQEPVGKRLVIYYRDRDPWQIVGVVGNVRSTSLDHPAEPHIYLSFRQAPVASMELVLRTNLPSTRLVAAVRQTVHDLDASIPIYNVQTMDQRLAETLAERRLNLLLICAFGVLGLLLAALGLYGVISYWVSQRTREIGVCMALGAQRRDVVRLVMRQGVTLTAVGLGLGLAGAFVLSRTLANLLFEVSATDAATFSAVSVLLAVVALAASYLPARRATRLNPVTALRYD